MARRMMSAAAVTALVLGLASTASAGLMIPINNYSFEAPDIPDGGWNQTMDWTKVQGVLLNLDPNNNMLTGTTGAGAIPGGQGTQVLALTGDWNVVGIGRQSVGAFEAGNTYTLTVAVGDRLDKTYSPVTIAFTDLTTTYASKYVGAGDVPSGSLADFELVWTPTSDVSNVYIQFTGGSVSPGYDLH
jgi:hypothetical protein